MKTHNIRLLSALMASMIGAAGFSMPSWGADPKEKVVLAEARLSMESVFLQEGPVRFVDPSGLVDVYLDQQKVSLQVDQELWDQIKDLYDKEEVGSVPGSDVPSSPQDMEEQGELVDGKGREIMAEAGLNYDQIVADLSADLNARLQSGTATVEEVRDGAERRFQADLIANPERNLEAGMDGRGSFGGGEVPGNDGGAKGELMAESGWGHDFGSENPANDGSNNGPTQSQTKNPTTGEITMPVVDGTGKKVGTMTYKPDRGSDDYKEAAELRRGLVVEQRPLVGAIRVGDAEVTGDAILEAATLSVGTAAVSFITRAPAVLLALALGSLIYDDNPQTSYVSAEDRGMAIVEAAAQAGAGGNTPAGSGIGLGINSPGGKPGGPFEQNMDSYAAGVHDSDVGGVGKNAKLEGIESQEQAQPWKRFWKTPGGQKP